MTSDEREKYLADLHVGVIAVERPDRAPLSVPIWYRYEPGGDVVIWTARDSVKHKHIRDAGRFVITVQDEQQPYRYVTAEGDVTAIEPAAEAEVRGIAIRYLGDEEGNRYVDQVFDESWVIIRMRPRRWLSSDESKQ